LLSKIIVYDPEKRLTPALALEHRFFALFNIEKRYFGGNSLSKSSHTMITRSVSKLISTVSSSQPMKVPHDHFAMNDISFSRSVDTASVDWSNQGVRSRKQQRPAK
jgi:hypothetical protein